MKVASIDVGTNTALMLIADVEEQNISHIYLQKRHFVRLGDGLDSSGTIAPAAIKRYRDAMRDFRKILRDEKVDQVIVAGTSASRDADNVGEIESITQSELGVPYRILSGDEEAKCSFDGAVVSVDANTRSMRPLGVLDIGGGSTEIVTKSAQDVLHYCSLDIGSVRMTNRYFPNQPPTNGQIQQLRNQVDEIVGDAMVEMPAGGVLLGVAGTMSTLLFLESEVQGWNVIEHPSPSLSLQSVEKWAKIISGKTFDEVLDLSPEVMTGRADVILAGIMILSSVLRNFGFDEIIVVRGGLRHGLALMAARENSASEKH